VVIAAVRSFVENRCYYRGRQNQLVHPGGRASRRSGTDVRWTGKRPHAKIPDTYVSSGLALRRCHLNRWTTENDVTEQQMLDFRS
jgi:hypothetical protein